MGYTRVGDLLLGMLGLALLRSRVEELGGKAFCDARVAEIGNLLDHWDDPALRQDAEWEDAAATERRVATALLQCDERLLTIHDILGDNRQRFAACRVDAYIGTNGADRAVACGQANSSRLS